jgi:hypothetical protein
LAVIERVDSLESNLEIQSDLPRLRTLAIVTPALARELSNNYEPSWLVMSGDVVFVKDIKGDLFRVDFGYGKEIQSDWFNKDWFYSVDWR